MSSRANDMMKQQLSDDPLNIPGPMETYGVQPPGVVPRRSLRQADQNALVTQGDGNFSYKRFQMTPVGMLLPEDTSGDEWEEVGWALKGIDNAISWWVGDWAVFAMQHWKWTAAQVATMFDYTPETIETYAWICTSISGSIRNRAVFFSHHRQVAKLDEMMQQAWLTYAEFFIQLSRLKVEEFKQDIAAVEIKSDDDKLRWMQHAMEIKTRLSQIEDLKPPTLSSPNYIPKHIIKGKTSANRAWRDVIAFINGRYDWSSEKVDQRIDEIEAWLQDVRDANRRR